jgi:diadenosine tetraphosphate (Ap4A) HIT family hydrolase
MNLYHLGNSRGDEQTGYMRELEAAGICVFCPEHLEADPDQVVTHRTAHWTITPNKFPYASTTLHLMLVPHEHVADLLDLTEAAQRDFWTALGWIRKTYGLTYYGLGARNGDPRFTGGTITHVHVHVIVGDPNGEPVRFKVSSPDPEIPR